MAAERIDAGQTWEQEVVCLSVAKAENREKRLKGDII